MYGHSIVDGLSDSQQKTLLEKVRKELRQVRFEMYNLGYAKRLPPIKGPVRRTGIVATNKKEYMKKYYSLRRLSILEYKRTWQMLNRRKLGDNDENFEIGDLRHENIQDVG